MSAAPHISRRLRGRAALVALLAATGACTGRGETPPSKAVVDTALTSIDDALPDAPAARVDAGRALNGDALPGATPATGWRGFGAPGSTRVPNVILEPPTAGPPPSRP